MDLIYNCAVFEWLFIGMDGKGFISDYQTLLAGFLAFGAGYFVYSAAQLKLNREKEQDLEIAKRYRIYYAREARGFFGLAGFILHIATKEKLESKRYLPLLKNLNTHFLKEHSHLIFFDSKAIALISEIEELIDHSNAIISQMFRFIEFYPNKPLSSKYNERNTSVLTELQNKSQELSIYLDQVRWDKWYSNKVIEIPKE